MQLLKRAFVTLFFLLLAGVAGFLVFGPAIVEKGRNVVADHDPYPVSPEAQALHDSLTIGDWHADPLLWNRDLSQRGSYGQVDIPRLLEGNVAVQVFTAVTKSPAGLNYDRNEESAFDNVTLLAIAQLWPVRTWNSLLERAVYQAQKLRKVERALPESFVIIRTVEDLDNLLARRAAGEKVVGGLLGIEGGHPLEGRIANLDRLEAAGYRLIGLQHFFDNELGGSLHGVNNAGLTDFGEQVVEEIVRRGLILDVAHSSEQVVRDVLAMTDIPVVLSHTGVKYHCNTKRNISDELMREIAATGGVIGMGYWLEVTCDDSPRGIANSINAAIALVGEDAVSLGSDFDGSIEARLDTSELAAITQELLNSGLTEEQIRKVMGGNMIRVLRARLSKRP